MKKIICITLLNVWHKNPCHHSMACPQIVIGGDGLQMWRVAVTVLNKHLQMVDKGWSSSLWVGQGVNNLSLQMSACYKVRLQTWVKSWEAAGNCMIRSIITYTLPNII